LIRTFFVLAAFILTLENLLYPFINRAFYVLAWFMFSNN
jgi:hypothetical protein